MKSVSGVGSISSRHDTELAAAVISADGRAPDMDQFHTSLLFAKTPVLTSPDKQTTPSSIQTVGELEEIKTDDNLFDDMYESTSSNGGNPSQRSGIYESSGIHSTDGGGYQERIQSDLDSSDALSMSFRSVDMHSERRGSIEVKFSAEDMSRLHRKRAKKMRQMQGGCDSCTDGMENCAIF